MKIRKPLAIAGVLLAFVTATQAQAQVLDQVPAEALVVLKVSSLSKLSAKVAKYAKGLGVDQMQPELSDPLGALEEQAHLSKGIDKAGDLAIAYFDPAASGAAEDDSFIVVIPTSDYQAFLTNFKKSEAQGELTQVTPEAGGKDVFVAHWGKYAAVSASKGLLGKKPTGIKLAGVAAKESGSKDAIVYANVKQLRGILLPQLEKSRADILNQVTKSLETAGDAAKPYAPVVKALVGQALNVAQSFLRDSNGATIGLLIGEDGILASVSSDFEADSYIGKMALGMKGTDASMLAGLPNRKYFMFGGSVNDTEVGEKVFKDLVGPIKDELAKVEQAKAFVPALDSMEKAVASTRGSAVGMVAPKGALGAESVLQQVQVTYGDAKALHASALATMEAVGSLYSAMPQQKDMKMGFAVKRGAKTIGGVSFDTFETKMEIGDDNPQAAQIKQMMGFIYGPNGQSGVIGEASDKAVLTVAGGNEELIADSITSAKAGTDNLGDLPAVKGIAAQLPKMRTGAAYVDVGQFVTTAVGYAKGLGLPIPVKIPQNLPPIGSTFGTEESSIRMDVYIPNTLVQGLVSAAMQAQQQMKNGPGGGL